MLIGRVGFSTCELFRRPSRAPVLGFLSRISWLGPLKEDPVSQEIPIIQPSYEPLVRFPLQPCRFSKKAGTLSTVPVLWAILASWSCYSSRCGRHAWRPCCPPRMSLPSPRPLSGFPLIKSGPLLLVLGELIVLNLSFLVRKQVSASFVTCSSYATPTHPARANPGLLAPQVISFLFPQWPCFDIFDEAWFRRRNVVAHAKCTQSALEARTGPNTSGQAVALTRDLNFTAFGQAQFWPGEEEGQPKVP